MLEKAKTGQTRRKKGCSTARRICIVCLKTPIHKNDSLYESKVCFRCTAESGLGAARTPRQPASQVPSASRASAGQLEQVDEKIVAWRLKANEKAGAGRRHHKIAAEAREEILETLNLAARAVRGTKYEHFVGSLYRQLQMRGYLSIRQYAAAGRLVAYGSKKNSQTREKPAGEELMREPMSIPAIDRKEGRV